MNDLWNERGNYEMFFAAKFKEGSIQYADISFKKRGGKDTIYPSQTVHHKQLEKAKFTYIDNKKDITSVRFLKSNGKDAYEVIKYGDPIKVKVQTRNLEGTKLKLTILRNRFGNGIDKFPVGTQKTVENESVEWTVNTSKLKEKIKKADWTKVSFWQVELEESDGDKFKYPDQSARLKDGNIDWTKLMTYQSLKLSDNAVVSELAKTNAPLVVGVPLEAEQHTHEDGKCPRCGILTIEEVDKIFTSATTENKNYLITSFNEGNLKFGIDTCLKKAHFFAQVLQEVGTSLKLNEPESFNYSARRLKDGDYVSGNGWKNGNKATGEEGHYTSGTWKASPFSYFKTHHNEADKYGRKDLFSYNDKGIQAANSEEIANIVYADKNRLEKYKLGNIYDGDGWKFMGKGIIQVTGRSNYTEVNKRLEKYGFKFNIVNNPNILLSHREGVLASMAYWYWKDLQIKSEKGQTREIVDSITKIVNEGTDTQQKRWDNFVKLLNIFKVNDCQKDMMATNENLNPCKEDYSQCILYADVWDNPVISNDNGGKNNNRYGHGSTRGHKGLDILTGESYKIVHSTMCGEVVSIVNSFKTNEYKKSSLGNSVMIKSNDKDNRTVFMLYCHLDEIYVKKGDKVCHGQKIALSGSTGNAAEILDSNGNLKNGIRKENWHVHIEAATKGEGYNNFYSLGSYRIQPENYMKTKFDENGNPIK